MTRQSSQRRASPQRAAAPRSAAQKITYLLEPKNWIIVTVVGVGWHAGGVRGLGWGVLAALFAAVIPTLFITRGVRDGKWTDRNVGDKRPRLTVLSFIIASVAAGLVILAAGGAPRELTGYLACMLASVAVLAAITTVWKISIHCAVASGSVTILALIFGLWVTPAYALVALTAWSRVALRAHTTAQVVAGAVLGALAAAASYAIIRLPERQRRSPRAASPRAASPRAASPRAASPASRLPASPNTLSSALWRTRSRLQARATTSPEAQSGTFEDLTYLVERLNIRYVAKETVICTYRVREDDETTFRELLGRHWRTLRDLGFVTDEGSLVFRGTEGGLTYVEIFSWVEGGFGQAHEHPDVLAIWEAMDPLLEERGALPKWEFPHFEQQLLPA